jgi:hypothetical protein
VLAWDLGPVAETWLRYIRGASPAGDGAGASPQLQGSAGR